MLKMQKETFFLTTLYLLFIHFFSLQMIWSCLSSFGCSPESKSVIVHFAVLLHLLIRSVFPDAHRVGGWTVFASGVTNDASVIVRMNRGKVHVRTNVPRLAHRPKGGIDWPRPTARRC